MASAQGPSEQNAGPGLLPKQIEAAIAAADGWIGFDRYMQLALYTPGLGYYSGSRAKFGEAGDFITAPEMGGLFGACLGGQVAEVFEQTGTRTILEFGAGSGALALSVLKELERLGSLPDRYLILEVSGALRARQAQTLRSAGTQYFERVGWLESLPDSFSGVVLANEVLDAMPFRVFERSPRGDVDELGVVIDEKADTGLGWQARPADSELAAAVNSLGIESSAAYRSEICPQAVAWLRSIADVLQQGVLFLVDYGFPQHEYYHPDRHQGTLMCHFRHRVHDDPFFRPGEQDITAHVDFSAIARAGQAAGLAPLAFANQAAFLIGAGLLQRIPTDASVREQLELAQQVKKLTLPHEMGELFKVLVLARDCRPELSGFAEQNQVHRLLPGEQA